MIHLRNLLAMGLVLAGTLAHSQDLDIEIAEETAQPELGLSFEGVSLEQGGVSLEQGGISLAGLDQVLAPSADFLVADDQALSLQLTSGASIPVILGDELFVIADETFDPERSIRSATLAAPIPGANDALISAVGQDPWCSLKGPAALTEDLQNWIIGDAHVHLRVPVAAWALCGDLLTFGERTAAPLQQVLRLESIPVSPDGPVDATALLAALEGEFAELPKVSGATLATLPNPVSDLPWSPGLSLIESGHGGADPSVPFSDLYGSLRAAQDRLTLSTQNLAN